jgi:hypothetical protein
MTLEAFTRNLRGVNGGADFPAPLLAGVYEGIRRAPLRTSEGARGFVVACVRGLLVLFCTAGGGCGSLL